MILRTLAIVFLVASLLTALYAGPGRTVGDALAGSTLTTAESIVARYATSALWDVLVYPFLSLPVWAGWLVPAGIFLVAAALRPGRG
ncbi:hypothetical protein [Neoroseomonas oryzicola]|uniref:Uncharacterized protein n=1 Tax=Neoroseomonas oryzicola TaxID=535904 RepID=A0A9X9WF06_9PROT|nr:hypothetical protein [Neoroseomonas oryzicola]MBR0658916.1 hypothetical protein [Neoroseomonas oryzicola]NKE15732.1 hypothetical protein [Neoroseomonas oryzicola]